MAFSVWNFVRSYLSIIQIASGVSKRRRQQTKQLKSSWWPKMICGIFCTENDQIVIKTVQYVQRYLIIFLTYNYLISMKFISLLINLNLLSFMLLLTLAMASSTWSLPMLLVNWATDGTISLRGVVTTSLEWRDKTISADSGCQFHTEYINTSNLELNWSLCSIK